MGSPPSYEDYCVANTLNGDIHFTQYTIGETDEEYIWMDRTKEQLFEIERNPVEKMLEPEDRKWD
jgi:hypothetical protein